MLGQRILEVDAILIESSMNLGRPKFVCVRMPAINTDSSFVKFGFRNDSSGQTSFSHTSLTRGRPIQLLSTE